MIPNYSEDGEVKFPCLSKINVLDSQYFNLPILSTKTLMGSRCYLYRTRFSMVLIFIEISLSLGRKK